MTKAQLTMETPGKFSSRTPPNISLREAIEWHRLDGDQFANSILRSRDGEIYKPGVVAAEG